jgi:sirohydrochlorin cobaltochelatase
MRSLRKLEGIRAKIYSLNRRVKELRQPTRLADGSSPRKGDPSAPIRGWSHSTCARGRLLNVSSVRSDDSALLIVAHGSTVNPDSSAPTLAHAVEIRRWNVFGDVACAFWKEEPSLRDAMFLFPQETIRQVYVVPNFISEGYFTQTVIPRELELRGRSTTRASGQVWNYCEPVGSHPMVTDLLLQRAREVAPGIRRLETTFLIVAHGTDLNENSAVAAKREAQKIRTLGLYADVQNVYMEEAPRVADWRRLTTAANVVVVPFFIADGLHSYEDIPVLLGIAEERSEMRDEVFDKNPYNIDNRRLFYASSIGTDRRVADVILAQVEAFDREKLHASASS